MRIHKTLFKINPKKRFLWNFIQNTPQNAIFNDFLSEFLPGPDFSSPPVAKMRPSALFRARGPQVHYQFLL